MPSAVVLGREGGVRHPRVHPEAGAEEALQDQPQAHPRCVRQGSNKVHAFDLLVKVGKARKAPLRSWIQIGSKPLTESCSFLPALPCPMSPPCPACWAVAATIAFSGGGIGTLIVAALALDPSWQGFWNVFITTWEVVQQVSMAAHGC